MAVKCYQSDKFNNYLDNEWIDDVNARSSINISDDQFTIDQLIMGTKLWEMLNSIAVSGGSYDDWKEVVWDHRNVGKPENPVYVGGLSKELIFEAVVSNAAQGDQPLGT